MSKPLLRKMNSDLSKIAAALRLLERVSLGEKDHQAFTAPNGAVVMLDTDADRLGFIAGGLSGVIREMEEHGDRGEGTSQVPDARETDARPSPLLRWEANAPKSVLTIHGNPTEFVLEIHDLVRVARDGHVEYLTDCTPDEAAQAFWEAIGRWNVWIAAEHRAEAAERRVEQLEAPLREIADLDDPHHRGHTRFIRAVEIAQDALKESC